MNKKVSIIVPVYNSGPYLEECIRSILRQTYTNIEIILINDGSSDNSLSIIKKFLPNKQITLFSQRNKGVSVARNRGLDLATGEYVIFIDSDDTVSSNYIENLLSRANDPANNLTVSNLLYMRTMNSVWAKLYKISDVTSNYFDEELSIAEDLEYNYRLLSSGAKITVADEKLYNYRRNEAGATRSKYARKRMDGLRVARELRPISKATENRYFNEAFFIIESMMKHDAVKDNIDDYNICMDVIRTHRRQVVFDKRSTLRTRIVALSSYVSINVFIRAVLILSRLRAKVGAR